MVLAMSATTAAAGPSTDATANATTSTTAYQPTGASRDRDIEENDPPYNNTEPKAPPYSETADNAGTAPLLPTYSFAVASPPPRATTWRSRTGGLFAENTLEDETQAEERKKHPGVCKVYGSKTNYQFIQWFATTVVLGTSAQSLHLSDKLPSAVPMLAYLLTCAVVHIIPMYYFIREKTPVSSKDPRLPRWYLISYGVSCLSWVPAMVCVVLVEVQSHQFRYDRNKEDGMVRCGKKQCYPHTPNARINTNSCICIAAISFILAAIILHWYYVSKLWRCKFTADEIRAAYEYVPKAIWDIPSDVLAKDKDKDK